VVTWASTAHTRGRVLPKCSGRDGGNRMFSHVMVGGNHIAGSKKFYDALFLAIGGNAGVEDAKGR
jgi:hypothetical protein